MKEIQKRTKKIKTGDRVYAIAGNSRGLSGTVLRVTEKGAVVQGLNIKKKSVKKSEAKPKGGFVDVERPIHMSNLMVCSTTDQPLKLKMKVAKDRSKHLVHAKDGSEVVHRNVRNQKAAG